jgi:hypothetical protein
MLKSDKIPRPQSGKLSRLANWGLAKARVPDFILAIGVLFLVAVFSWNGVRSKSTTVDEVAHVFAGHAYWQLNDYRLLPESGNLPDRIAALPLQFGHNPYPINLDSREWLSSKQWDLARLWWYGSGYDPIQILSRARMAMLAFNLMGLGLIFLLSSRLWGRGAGFFSLILAGFCPNFLGHMPLATSDFAGAWTLVLAVVCYARMLDRPSAGYIVMAGLTAGIAVITKHSGLIVGPVAFFLLVWAIQGRRPIKLVTASLAAALISYCVIWTAYGWRYSAANPEIGTIAGFQVDWSTLHEGGTFMRFFLGISKDWHLLPEAFLFGLDFIFARSDRGGFLNGVFSENGYALFYLWNFLYKTPIPAMILHVMGWSLLPLMILRKEERTKPEFRALLVLGGFYVLILLTTNLNIGYRHAFTALYISCIFSSLVLVKTMAGKPRLVPAVGLCALSLVPLAFLNANRYISYINPIGGGEKNGYLTLTDSSLDWGQDLPAVARYITTVREKDPATRFFLCTTGTGSPQVYGIRETGFLPFWGFSWREAFLPELSGGTFIISASALALLNTQWEQEQEMNYRKLKGAASNLYNRLEATGTYRVETAMKLFNEEEIAVLDRFEQVRCQRLVYYLRNCRPDTVLNGTMVVFNLSDDELSELNW